MKTICAQTTLRKYPVYIGRGIIDTAPELLNKHFFSSEKILFVTNDVVNGIYGETIDVFLNSFTKSLKKIVLKDGEEQKSLENTKYIYENMLDLNMHRDDVVIAFGGGVIGDLAGFAASTFHRGVKLLQIPTTIISQVDSSIGGKAVVNFKDVKNVIGSFYQPHAIIMDTLFLQTLQEKDIINGLAEIVKYGIIFDRKILELLNNLALQISDTGTLKELISLPQFEAVTYSCAKIKTSVVKKDEFDSNYRNLLNFGHTAGHALEKISGFKGINHGQAVAIGMIIAIDISISLGLLGDSFRHSIISLYKKLKLPYSFDYCDDFDDEKSPGNFEIHAKKSESNKETLKGKLADDIFDAMKFDKKFSASANKFVLLKALNRPVFYRNVGTDIIKEAIFKNISVRL